MTRAELERAYRGARVVVTGHTGFKGSWLTLWLATLGADVTGLALEPERPSLFLGADVASRGAHVVGDIRDIETVTKVVAAARPDVVFHLAAQALVRRAAAEPAATFSTNVVGTVAVLDAVRRSGRSCGVVVVTSDKCYAPHPTETGYREDDPLGGDEPYAASKAAAELAVAGYRAALFPPDRLAAHGVAVATARAGNVIGGGDWALDRIVPDAIRALVAGEAVPIRNPGHVRPWQHVLDPLAAYLLLGARLRDGSPDRARYAGAWNVGPARDAERTVSQLVDVLLREWGSGSWVRQSESGAPHETPVLRLDSAKARRDLGWSPRWDLGATCARTVEWYRAQAAGAAPTELRAICERQIAEYLS